MQEPLDPRRLRTSFIETGADVFAEIFLGGGVSPAAKQIAEQAPSVAVVTGLAMHAVRAGLPPVFVEIGVQRGISTRCLLTVAGSCNGRVVSMDIDPACGRGPLLDWANQNGLAKHWEFRAGPSDRAEPVPGAGFLLVDGCHDYGAVCADMARHGAAVADGGIILLDDYNFRFPGKVRWLAERWDDLRPLTIGPWAMLVKRPGDDQIYRDVRGGP